MTTVFYTQEQVNEIGAAIRKELDENHQKIKDDVQKLIDNLKPVQPTAPTAPTEPPAAGAGGGNEASGTFLDDGRQIKQRVFGGEITDLFVIAPHGIPLDKIISASCILINGYENSVEPSLVAGTNDYAFKVQGSDYVLQFSQGAALDYGRYAIVITYLA